LLEPWLADGTDDRDATVLTTPKGAAARATFEACITHAGKRGTVLVKCDEAAGARDALSFLRAWFEDEPRLSPLLKRVGNDELLLTPNTLPRSHVDRVIF